MSASIISTKRLGEIEVSMVNSGRILWTPTFDIDQNLEGNTIDRDEAGRLRLGHNVMCVKTPTDIVLVDPTAWNEDEDYGEVEVVDAHSNEEALEALGITADDVSHVAISHLHFDHVTGLVKEAGGTEVARFPNAEVHVPALDWEHLVERNEAGSRERLLRYVGPVEQAGKLRKVDGDADICPGVRAIHTGGESPGHQAIQITGGGKTVYYLGDQFHWTFEFPRPDWTPMQGKILEQLAAGRRKILTEATEREATLVFTHAPFPGWGSVDPDTWNWQYEAVAAPA